MKSIKTMALSAALASIAHAQNNSDCVSGVHIIVARGSTEAPGEGIIGVVANNVTSRIPDSDSVAVPYPATIENYISSENEGVGNTTKLIEEYGDACPSAKMVLMGYSQGAQVIGDTLIGSPGPPFNIDTALPTKYLNQILAVIMMGDPTYVPGLPFNVGNATKPGVFERRDSDQWAARGLDSRIQSYCDANDLYCSSGDSLAVHAGYVGEYGAQAADFVVQRYEAAVGSSSSSSAAASSSTTASASISSSASSLSASLSSAISSTTLSSASASSVAASSSANTSGGSSSSSSASAMPSSSAAASGGGSSSSGSAGSGASTPTTTAQTGAASDLRSSVAGFAVAGLLTAVLAFAL